MIRAVVFDFDGVIVDSEAAHFEALQKTVAQFGIRFDFDFYLKNYLGFDDRETLKKILPEKDSSPEQIHALVLEKAKYLAQSVDQVRPVRGFEAFVESIPAEIKVALCSGAIRHDIDTILARLFTKAFIARFVSVVSADDVKNSKPNPAPYLLTLKNLALPPSDAFAIEDSLMGLQSASQAGLRTVGLATTCALEKIRGACTLALETFEKHNFTSLCAALPAF